MMKTQVEYAMMDAVFRAKLDIESIYFKGDKLRWSYYKPVDLFEDDRNRVELYVLEGMPPRGFIIANYATQTVKALDMDMSHRTTKCVKECPAYLVKVKE